MPASVPKSEPLPSITMKPNLSSDSSSSCNAWSGARARVRARVRAALMRHHRCRAVGEAVSGGASAQQKGVESAGGGGGGAWRWALGAGRRCAPQGGGQAAAHLGVELVVAQVEGGVDRLEGLEVDVHLLLFVVVRQNCAAVDDQTVGRHLAEELQPLLG